MLQHRLSVIIATSLCMVVAGCGGGDGGGAPAPKVQFTSLVVFGDSLSDVGTYAVDGVAALGGGRFTINEKSTDGKPVQSNWTELIAKDLSLPVPCPAETGLDGDYFNAAPAFYTPRCTNYAQGGARITDPYGPGNRDLEEELGGNAVVGALTEPIKTQLQRHLTAHGGLFSGTEIVFLLAGGNDAIVNMRAYMEAIVRGGVTPATAEAAAVQAMTTAGTEFAGYVNNLILAKGAKYVLVLNLPDLGASPLGTTANALLPGTKAVVDKMVGAFNTQLKTLLTSPNVLVGDLNAASAEQISHPANFGLSNVTDTACDLVSTANPFGSALFCNKENLIPGDVSRYAFADEVHPTPYGNVLIALFASQLLASKGWL